MDSFRKHFLCVVLVVNVCIRCDPVVVSSVESDSELLDTFLSIWQTTKLYPEGNFYALYNQQLEGCIGVHPLTTSSRSKNTSAHNLLGTKLALCGDGSTPATKFIFLYATHGLLNICPYGLSYCLNNGLRQGGYVILGRWRESPSHQYRITSFNGTAQFVNHGSNTCLTAGSSYVKATPCDPKNPLQQWQICAPFNIHTGCWPKHSKDAPVFGGDVN